MDFAILITWNKTLPSWVLTQSFQQSCPRLSRPFPLEPIGAFRRMVAP
jgi:hypothetical protein